MRLVKVCTCRWAVDEIEPLENENGTWEQTLFPVPCQRLIFVKIFT